MQDLESFCYLLFPFYKGKDWGWVNAEQKHPEEAEDMERRRMGSKAHKRGEGTQAETRGRSWQRESPLLMFACGRGVGGRCLWEGRWVGSQAGGAGPMGPSEPGVWSNELMKSGDCGWSL